MLKKLYSTIINPLLERWLTVLVLAKIQRTRQEAQILTQYLVAGVSGALINFVILVGLTEGVQMSYMISNLIGAEAGILSTFAMNDQWTFAGIPKKHPFTTRLMRYHGVALVGMAIANVVLYLLVEWAHLHYTLGFVISLAAGFVWNFWANRRHTFVSPTDSSSKADRA